MAQQEMGKKQTAPRSLINQEVRGVHVGAHVTKEQWDKYNSENSPRMNFGVTEDVGL